MPRSVTSTDLDDWSRRQDAQSHLPTLVRPTGHGVPAGRSVWEAGTDHNPKGKADKDYAKRLAQVPAGERAATTFVFVTSRVWTGATDWARPRPPAMTAGQGSRRLTRRPWRHGSRPAPEWQPGCRSST